MNSHAYLIMAHENTPVLHTLLRLIDDVRNDIYIHMDKKVDFSFTNELRAQVRSSKLYFISNRVDVSWANISQVEAELCLFQEARNNNLYAYYHLLSGADLPLKTQDEMHKYFQDNQGFEFIGFAKEAIPDRVRFIHLFPKRFRSTSKIIIYIRRIFIWLQKVFKYDRFSDLNNYSIRNGTNWVSITNELVDHLLDNQNLILSKMKYAKSPDEYYKQTLVYNSAFKDRVFNLESEFDSCKRLIDWERGKPYEWQISDYDEIIKSNKLFIRKIGKYSQALYEGIEKITS